MEKAGEHIILLPPRPGACKECACFHAPALPHDPNSLYYQMHFYQKHRRFPTWSDAMAHCDDAVKQAFMAELAKHGILTEKQHGLAVD